MEQFPNPPLVEAICGFQFEPGSPWDWTIPGLVYDKIKTDFPQKTSPEPAFNKVMNIPLEMPGFSASMRMQFRKENGSALVQLAPNNLTVNHLQPYPGWPTYRNMIINAYNIYREVAAPKGLQRVELRYINRIALPHKAMNDQGDILIEDYLLASPSLPRTLPQKFTNWAQRVEIPIDSAPYTLIMQTGTLPGDAISPVVFLLDLQIAPHPQIVVTLDSACDWIEQAHEQIDEAFAQSVGPKARMMFENSFHEVSA